MSFFDRIILLLAERALARVAISSKREFDRHAAEIEAGKIDEQNLLAYNQAKNRKRRVEVALKLLNRSRS